MADLRIVRGTSSITRGTGDDAWMPARGTRDGALFTAPWVLGLFMEGRVFCANVGSITGPATFGAGSITVTEVDAHLIPPAGTTIIPLEIRVKMEAYGSNAIFEGMAAVGSGSVAGTDTDLTAGTLFCSMRTDAPFTSGTYVGHSSTATATYFTANSSEFWRFGLQKAATTATADDNSVVIPQTWVWNYKESGFFPIIKGDGADGLMIYASGQAGTGFITVIFAEVPSSSIMD